MNTLDDLRRTLEDQAGRAPDERGLIEGARTGAARIRRRRRVSAAAGTAAAVLVSALVVPFAVRHESAPPVGPATPSASAAPAGPRRGSDLTVGFARGKGLTVTVYLLDASGQYLAVVRDDGTEFSLDVANPGASERGLPIEGAVRVRVGDRDGWYLARPAPRRMYSKPTTEHLLTWETKDGFGVSFSSVSGKADLLATARAIRFVRPAPPSGPLQLGWVPDGLAAGSVEVFNDKKTETIRLSPPVQNPPDTGISVRVDPALPGWRNRVTQGKPPTHTIAGYQAWYEELPLRRDGARQATLLVTAGDCRINIQTAGPTTFADLERLVEEATIGSCTSQDGWGPIVP